MTEAEFSSNGFTYNDRYSLVEIGVSMEYAPDPQSDRRVPCRVVYDANRDLVYIEQDGNPQLMEPSAEFLSHCYAPAGLHGTEVQFEP